MTNHERQGISCTKKLMHKRYNMKVLDLDKKTREPRWIIIDGTKIWCTVVPAKTTILMDQIHALSKTIKPNDPNTIEIYEKTNSMYIKAILVTIRRNDNSDEITEEWLLERCSYDDFNEILMHMHGYVKKKEETPQEK